MEMRWVPRWAGKHWPNWGADPRSRKPPTQTNPSTMAPTCDHRRTGRVAQLRTRLTNSGRGSRWDYGCSQAVMDRPLCALIGSLVISRVPPRAAIRLRVYGGPPKVPRNRGHRILAAIHLAANPGRNRDLGSSLRDHPYTPDRNSRATAPFRACAGGRENFMRPVVYELRDVAAVQECRKKVHAACTLRTSTCRPQAAERPPF